MLTLSNNEIHSIKRKIIYSEEFDLKLNSYEDIRKWRDKEINTVSWDHEKLNCFHDEIMKKTVEMAVKKVESELGPIPTHFAFFVMGSAGRREQSVWSDQDHGIVFRSSSEFQRYFLKLGEEISDGLEMVGYEKCDGKVMASNPLWCKSLNDWKLQITQWCNEADWESLRYFSTFADARVLFGDERLLTQLREHGFIRLEKDPFLYKRLLENVGYIKKSFGIFGQLLHEENGENAGTLNIKQAVFFPFVNSLRLLAFIEQITTTSTIDRFQQLSSEYASIKLYQADFIKLLNYRLYFQRQATNYQKVHLLDVKSLSKKEKQEIKKVMKKAYRLFKETKQIIENRCSP